MKNYYAQFLIIMILCLSAVVGRAAEQEISDQYFAEQVKLSKPVTGKTGGTPPGENLTAPANDEFGTSLDTPQPGDYGGDGKGDLGLFRASTGEWYRSASVRELPYVIKWGQPGDKPVSSMARFSLPEVNE